MNTIIVVYYTQLLHQGPDAGDSDRGVRGSVQSVCGGPDLAGPDLAHLCEP